MSEKRSVSTDALETLGTIISEREKRDAIHLAVEPTKAVEKLYPGQDVGVDGTRNNPVGIVDPFLKAAVMPGDWFWLVVYPRQINSLRHVWTHPAFTDEPMVGASNKSASEAWLRNFCASADCPGYDAVMALISGDKTHFGGDDYGASFVDDEYIHFCGRDAHGEIPVEFWDHAEIVLGRKFANRPTYFACGC